MTHGNYQYFKLSELIDDILLEAQDDDSLIKNTKRSKFLNVAYRGIRELNRNVANDVLAFEITVPDSLYFHLPKDYVNWARVSVVAKDESTNSFRLFPLDVNYNINTAIAYLQDHKGALLYDSNGEILTAEASNALNFPYKSYAFCGADNQFTTDASKFSKNGEFKVDERRGVITFSSNLRDREIVMEYVSDGLQENLREGEITIHKHLREALYDFIIYKSISTKRSVSAQDKRNMKNKWLSSRHKAVMARADFDLLRIARAVRVKSKTL